MAATAAVESLVVVHNIAKRHNVGTMARSATAFGVSEMVLVGRRDFNAFGSHGSTSHLRFRHFTSLTQAAVYLKEERDCDICGVEIVDGAVPVTQHPFRKSTAFLLGNEGSGLSEKEYEICDFFVYIPHSTKRLTEALLPEMATTPHRLLGPPEIHGSPATDPNVEPDSGTGDPFINLMDASFNSVAAQRIGQPPMGLTENLSPTFLSSGDPCLDFFFQVVPSTSTHVVAGLLAAAWKRDPLTALKLVCHLRAVRGTGKSDRNGFYASALWVHDHHPKTLALNADTISGFGYLKDLPEILYRLLSGHVRCSDLASARHLFDQMTQIGDMVQARRLFDEAPHHDVFTWTEMVSGYAKNGMLEEARRVFDAMLERNSVSWNAMVAAYAQRKQMDEAKELFDAMPERNISSWNTMVTGYAQAGMLEEARCFFERMPQRDSISWSAMIAGCAQAGLGEAALRLFVEMERSGVRMNRSAFTSALSTCADIAVLECGKQVHARMVKAGYGMGCYVGNALLAMYCKCGNIDEAHDAFLELAEKDVVSWNTMIAGYARHGFGKEALEVFDKMRVVEIRPDDITLVGVLSACSHTGLVDKGIGYFHSMRRDFHIIAKPEHYTCMIDLLGRAGRLEEANGLIEDMPFEPDATMWGALLGASKKHGNTELGEKAAERLFEMEPDNSGMYVLLSNLYATSGKWKDVGKLRVMMRDRGIRKVPGFSWMEVNNKVHTFSVGDSVHPEKEKIYGYLEELDLKLKKSGYVSATKMVLHDVEEEEKAHMLKYHSERLAVVFGILNVLPGRPIRVIKNLRVCEDCHNAIKHISAIENRLIILRDSNRFHHFSGGMCSCGDYW